MKNLPIGIQSFTKLIDNNCVYVDKTRIIHELVTKGTTYFYSRPRRFGKSLLISTLKELFKGNKKVFKDLWIENNWDWEKVYPVIHISFDTVDYQDNNLAQSLINEMNECAEMYGVSLKPGSPKTLFKELLKKLHAKHGRVALLIDEYDKPIIDFLETSTMEQAKANRATLREFYAILKSADEHLRFVFITGISKFSKVSLFSHLNNLLDITINEDFAALTGYTQEEIELYFQDYLKAVADRHETTVGDILSQMKIWYNGYSWGSENRLYNPFGVLNFFFHKEFQNYWFSTGNPKFLIDQMKKHTVFNVENISASNVTFDRFDIENIELVSLLFQTGYLTIKERDTAAGGYILNYPNKEVRESMYQFIIDDLAKNVQRGNTGRTMLDLQEAFVKRDIEKVRQILNSILADLPYEVYEKQSEGFYHGLMHIIFSYLGMFVQSEVHASQGRADAVVETATDIFVFEFKYGQTAAVAMQQVHEKNYPEKYRSSPKRLTAVAFNFSPEKRGIDGWLVEEL